MKGTARKWAPGLEGEGLCGKTCMSYTVPTTTRLSTKGQVVLPSAVRERLRLRPGEELVVEVRGEEIVLRRSPRSWTEWGYGVGSHVWKGVDIEGYLRRERKSWERR